MMDNKIQYNEIILSVQLFDQDSLEPLKIAEAIKSDAVVIKAVMACISEGVVTKMKLAGAVSTRAGISKRSALKIIEQYTGDDPAKHKWSFAVRERGAKVFALLDTVTNDKSTPET